MRRLLFLSYYTPPRPGVATTRTRQLLRYLPEFGWDVTVVTAELPGADASVVQTPYVDLYGSVKRAGGFGGKSVQAALGVAPIANDTRPSLRQRAFLLAFRLLTYPDPEVGWFPHARRTLARLLRTETFDAVLSSSPPFTTNLILASLSPRIPWVADFRDLWSESGYYRGAIRNGIDDMLEKWTLRHAAALTTISEPLARVLRSHREGLAVEVIPNAYDPQEWEGVPFEVERQCTFVHAGQMFEGRRDPRPLFRAIRSLIDEGAITPDEVRVDLYATPEPWLARSIAAERLETVVNIPGVVPRPKVMAAERRADRLVVLLWEGANTEGIVTGKLFEYLGARRPILVIGGPQASAVDDVLDATRAGERARTDDALKNAIVRAVEEHRANNVSIVDAGLLKPFDAATMAQRFAELLDRTVDTKNRSLQRR